VGVTQVQKVLAIMGDFIKQLQSYRLTTAEILYHMPDHPDLLQTFIWQELDVAPRFPVLCRFLDFWSHKLDGKLHSVRVASVGLIKPSEFRYANCSLTLQ
jgi:uncharacterized protein Usg